MSRAEPCGAPDEVLMRQALGLARRGWGNTHPNPMVGALISENGRVVAEGFHARDGAPHAERVALAALGRRPKADAVLYVTLEPCSTEGRTGSCTEAILASGIRRVVAGATDPNPSHAGRGFTVLREAGVEVVSGVLGDACGDLNLIFNHWITRRQPLFAGKVAATLDGRMATRLGESKWITGEPARANGHRWRRLFPAIAVGAGTVAKDDPSLTARIAGEPEWAPVRFVFDGALRTASVAPSPRLFNDAFRARTVVVTTAEAGAEGVARIRQLGADIWIFDTPGRRVPWELFRARCAEAGISGVYFEGGSDILSQLIVSRQMDYLFVYQAPTLFGDGQAVPLLQGLSPARPDDAVRLRDVRRESLGEDWLTRGAVAYPNRLVVDENLPRVQ